MFSWFFYSCKSPKFPISFQFKFDSKRLLGVSVVSLANISSARRKRALADGRAIKKKEREARPSQPSVTLQK